MMRPTDKHEGPALEGQREMKQKPMLKYRKMRLLRIWQKF